MVAGLVRMRNVRPRICRNGRFNLFRMVDSSLFETWDGTYVSGGVLRGSDALDRWEERGGSLFQFQCTGNVFVRFSVYTLD